MPNRSQTIDIGDSSRSATFVAMKEAPQTTTAKEALMYRERGDGGIP
jgi:hypothetical protein